MWASVGGLLCGDADVGGEPRRVKLKAGPSFREELQNTNGEEAEAEIFKTGQGGPR